MKLTKEMHDRYTSGGVLTDEDVTTLLNYYEGLCRAMAGYTPREYLLMENAVFSHYERLTTIKQARSAR